MIGQPICGGCSGHTSTSVCRRCGGGEERYQDGRCARCVALDRLHAPVQHA